MDVKRCDRCGAIYDLEGSKSNGTEFLISSASIGNVIPSRVRYNGDSTYVYEICKHCMESFKHWFVIKDDEDE